jgi:hypothetical protein
MQFTLLHRIKLLVGFGWLGQQRIYLRTQRMPFKFGTNMYLMAFLTMEHPSVSNQSAIEEYIQMDSTVTQDTNNDNFLAHIQRLKDAKLIVDEVLTLPISVEQSITI